MHSHAERGNEGMEFDTRERRKKGDRLVCARVKWHGHSHVSAAKKGDRPVYARSSLRLRQSPFFAELSCWTWYGEGQGSSSKLSQPKGGLSLRIYGITVSDGVTSFRRSGGPLGGLARIGLY